MRSSETATWRTMLGWSTHLEPKKRQRSMRYFKILFFHLRLEVLSFLMKKWLSLFTPRWDRGDRSIRVLGVFLLQYFPIVKKTIALKLHSLFIIGILN